MIKFIVPVLLVFCLLCSAAIAIPQLAVPNSNPTIRNIKDRKIIIPAAESLPPDLSAQPTATEYVPNEIIVKFKAGLAETIETQTAAGLPPAKLKLSTSLDKLNSKYKLKKVRALFKNFKQKKLRIKALQEKNKALLSPAEKRILRRMTRAPRNVTVPDLSGIYRIRVDLKPGESLEQAVAAYAGAFRVPVARLAAAHAAIKHSTGLNPDL